jgi:hypothetical protein
MWCEGQVCDLEFTAEEVHQPGPVARNVFETYRTRGLFFEKARWFTAVEYSLLEAVPLERPSCVQKRRRAENYEIPFQESPPSSLGGRLGAVSLGWRVRSYFSKSQPSSAFK